MRAEMATSTCPLYCRICGNPGETPKGFPLHDSIAMKWWELDNLVKGLGCRECQGETPGYIRDMAPDERTHVQDGLAIQWMKAVRKACWPGQQPYPEFPEAIEYPLFLWAEPGISGRFSALGADVETLVESIAGGADNLRVHPESRDSEFDMFRYGLWHILPESSVSTLAETSSIRYMNALLLQDIFAGKSDLLGGSLWVYVGSDIDGVLTIDELTVSRIAVIESALAKFGCLTTEIVALIDLKK